MREQRIRVNDGVSFLERLVPIAHVTISATTEGAANTVYTVQDRKILKVDRLVAFNSNALAVDLTVHSIPDGGTIGAGNVECTSYAIPAGEALEVHDIIGGLYEGGTVLKAYCSIASAVIMHGYGSERS